MRVQGGKGVFKNLQKRIPVAFGRFPSQWILLSLRVTFLDGLVPLVMAWTKRGALRVLLPPTAILPRLRSLPPSPSPLHLRLFGATALFIVGHIGSSSELWNRSRKSSGGASSGFAHLFFFSESLPSSLHSHRLHLFYQFGHVRGSASRQFSPCNCRKNVEGTFTPFGHETLRAMWKIRLLRERSRLSATKP